MVFPPSLCPVPEEQQPLNEYRELKSSWFFGWAMLPWVNFVGRLGIVWLLGWLLSLPVSMVSFPLAKMPVQCLWASGLGALFPTTFVLVQLYLGWSYVRDRLANSTIFYEESGWYDGHYWTKPTEMLAQDQLVVTYQIQPLLLRIRKTLAFIALSVGLSAIAWQLL